MATVMLRPDTLDEEARRFAQAPLRQPLFLNSVPKSGSHLLRNIIRMFVPIEQQYRAQFIQWLNLDQHRAAFDGTRPKLSWGHMLFADVSAIALKDVRHILLLRDPYDWVLARARFFFSDAFRGDLGHIRRADLDAGELLNMMILGIEEKVPSLVEAYRFNVVGWLGTKAHLVRYEDLVRHAGAIGSAEAEGYFEELLGVCGIERPDDWRERVTIGADRRRSGTARENLIGSAVRLPDQLPEAQKRLVDYAAPGLRALLGYA